jgi:hypothetical protein
MFHVKAVSILLGVRRMTMDHSSRPETQGKNGRLEDKSG